MRNKEINHVNFWWLDNKNRSASCMYTSVLKGDGYYQVSQNSEGKKAEHLYKVFKNHININDVIFLVHPIKDQRAAIKSYTIIKSKKIDEQTGEIIINFKIYDCTPQIFMDDIPDSIHKNPDNKDGFYDLNNNIKSDLYIFKLSRGFIEYFTRNHQASFAYLNFKYFNQSWIFQCRLDLFDLQGALKELDHLTWLVNQHKQNIKKGDLVFLWESGKESGIVAIGNIVSDVEKIEENPEESVFNLDNEKFSDLQDRVRIEITQVLAHKLTKESLKKYPELSNLSILNFAQGTNFKVEENEANFLLSLIQVNDIDRGISKDVFKYTHEDLQEKTGIEREKVKKIIQNIKRKKNIIFNGSPGTGKTFVAGELAKYLISESDGFVEIVQFHPAYTYEDFIQGLRPLTDIDGNLRYEIVLGRFLEFCEEARQRDGDCVLIIDEINRANLSAVFGELMYLLEYRDQEIKLAGSNEPFSIPENVYIIGTMNTADRSINRVDHALRRRFAFIELRPDYDILRKWHEREETGFNVEPLITQIKEVNEAIGDRHYYLGISYFLDENLKENIADIWELEIYPYLEEYFYDNPKKCDVFKWKNIENVVLGETTL